VSLTQHDQVAVGVDEHVTETIVWHMLPLS
jgi:hypothetical protein